MRERPKNELSVNDLVKKIDEKLAEIEKEEEEARKKKEQEKEKETKTNISEAKIEPKEINNITINNYNQKDNSKDERIEVVPRKKTVSDYNKVDNIESLDEDDDFLISNEELEKKINDKLSSLSLDDEDNSEEENKDDNKDDNYEPFVPSKEDEELLKAIDNNLKQLKDDKNDQNINNNKPTSSMSKKDREKIMKEIEQEMMKAARELDFERATELRDILFEMRSE